MSGRTFAPADDPRLQEMVDNAPAGRDDRDDWFVEAGLDASAAAGISAIPTEEEHTEDPRRLR